MSEKPEEAEGKKPCDCISVINKDLEAYNAMLTWTIPDHKRALLATCKKNEKSRKKPPFVFASFCPFCGEKYPERELVK